MGGRVVEGTGLENRQAEMLRGFESHPIRFKKGAPHWHRSVANASCEARCEAISPDASGVPD